MEAARDLARSVTGLRAVAAGAAALALLAFVALGAAGTYRYARNYWLYRGFAPPRDPANVGQGSSEQLSVPSVALGGRRQAVDVYLPPGYAQDSQRRYPVVYLLHGFPGRPASFLLTVKAGVDEDVLIAQGRIQPVILVMPFGSTGTFTDEEWANGVNPNSAWETFVARDVVGAVDARYRTIPTGTARAIAGLSEGGYGALNIALHHPGEFHVVESWSGYELAEHNRSIFGADPRRLAYDSPLLQVGRAAERLRRDRTYFWFYSSSGDGPHLKAQNAQFAAALGRARVRHRFFVIHGGHDWRVWRQHAPDALLAAATRLHA